MININYNYLKITLFIIVMVILFLLYFEGKKNRKFRKIFGIYGLLLSSIYITWRIIFTLPTITTYDIIFAFSLLFFEILALIQNFVLRLLFSSDKSIELNEDFEFVEKPEVDVIISTYNEPKNILERTIIGCKGINYPEEKLNVFIGDDGKRNEIKKLAEKYEINYVNREENNHAKAGNINNVLKKANGDFILLLDADMIPKDTIVEKMLPYFKDKDTGFVQSPQVFYNLDPFQYNLDIGSNIPNEQDFFMRIMQKKRANHNAVLHVGTNAMFRRSAVDDIGGIPIGSITEDMATGMLIQNQGYKSFFIDEALALGLTVENFEDLLKQRDRWCRGNIQVIKKYNPLKMKNLSWKQKIIYLDGLFYWMFGLQKMVYIIAPLMFLLFRTLIFTANGFNLALMFLPHFISTSLYFKLITTKERNTVWSHIYDTAMAPKLAMSFLSEIIFKKDLKFNVTPKGKIQNKSSYNLKLAIVHIILFILSLTALFINLPLAVSGKSGIYLSGIIINIIWCVYNIQAIFISIYLALDKSRYRETERIPIRLRANALIKNCDVSDKCGSCGIVRDISERGANIKLKNKCPEFNFNVGGNIKINIEEIGTISAEIVRLQNIDKFNIVGVKFSDIGFEQFNKINKYRFDLRHKYVHLGKINVKYDSMFEVIFKIVKKMKHSLK